MTVELNTCCSNLLANSVARVKVSGPSPTIPSKKRCLNCIVVDQQVLLTSRLQFCNRRGSLVGGYLSIPPRLAIVHREPDLWKIHFPQLAVMVMAVSFQGRGLDWQAGTSVIQMSPI